MTRREFAMGALMASVMPGRASGSEPADDFDVRQREIDEITPADYYDYLEKGSPRFKALKRLDDAFEKAVAEAREAKVDAVPAVWLVYNMGLLVKTRETFFSVDLCHRLAPTIARELDFALITHNHNDHYTTEFYQVMDSRLHKTVVNNFACNYGARAVPYHNGKPSEFGGGYTRGGKSFRFRDVTVRTSVSDHNSYLTAFTMPFEICAGGFTIFHSGDSCSAEQLNPVRTPDLWVVHPRVGMKVVDGVKRFRPRKTVISHLNEFSHPKGRYRWTWMDGLAEKKAVESEGAQACVPVWGERLV